jgi:hypothetical protein
MSRWPDSSNRTSRTAQIELGRDRQVRCFIRRATATQHQRAIDDEHVPQQVSELARGVCAFHSAVTVQYEGAVAVIDIPAAV